MKEGDPVYLTPEGDLKVGQAGEHGQLVGRVTALYDPTRDLEPVPKRFSEKIQKWEELQSSFSGNKYFILKLDVPITAYRIGNATKSTGDYLSVNEPQSEIQARNEKGILHKWPNRKRNVLDTVYKVEIPAGTDVRVGIVGFQSTACPGGTQQLVPEMDWTKLKIEKRSLGEKKFEVIQHANSEKAEKSENEKKEKSEENEKKENSTKLEDYAILKDEQLTSKAILKDDVLQKNAILGGPRSLDNLTRNNVNESKLNHTKSESKEDKAGKSNNENEKKQQAEKTTVNNQTKVQNETESKTSDNQKTANSIKTNESQYRPRLKDSKQYDKNPNQKSRDSNNTHQYTKPQQQINQQNTNNNQNNNNVKK